MLKLNKSEKKPRNPIGTSGNSYNGRSWLGDQAGMRHDFRVSYLHNEVEWSIKTEFVIETLTSHEM